MVVINYIICIALIIGLCYNVYLMKTQNKNITFKGKEDFFSIMLCLLICIIFTYSSNNETIIELIRNILLYVFLFSTFAIYRGINEKGIIKLYRTIKWDNIKKIEVSLAQINKVQLIAYTENYKHKLLFHSFEIKSLLHEIDKYYDGDFKIQSDIANQIYKK